MIARVPPNATLEELTAANPGWKIELDADGSIVMSPGATKTGLYHVALLRLLIAWSDRVGGRLFDSSTGFRMPDTAVLSPDAAWMSEARWNSVDEARRAGYAPIVPDVCVEVVSPTDSVPWTVAKLRRYRRYGAAYVVMIDPRSRTVQADGEPPAGFPTDFTSVFEAAD